MRDKKDAPPGLDAGCVNNMGESLKELYERNAVDAIARKHQMEPLLIIVK
jgi:hypothetical protein